MSSTLLLVLALFGSAFIATAQNNGLHQHLLNSDGVDKFENSVSDKDSLAHFSSFLQKNKKQYKDVNELQSRFNIFNANQGRLQSLSSSDRGSAVYGNTKFSDYSAEEFKQKFTGHRSDLNITHLNVSPPPSKIQSGGRHKRSIPGSLDYRKKGIISSIKNQGSCGDCYAFASAAVLESVYALTYNVTPGDYSEEEITDCSWSQGNMGCDGGAGQYAFDYILANKGVTDEISYPFLDTADHSICSLKSDSPLYVQNLENYYSPEPSTEESIAQWLNQYGPMYIAISSEPLQFYESGILSPPEPADGWNVDHAVALIGYGVDCSGNPYWLAKNSWGPDWGEAGFFRFSRGQNTLDVTISPVAITFP